MEKKKILFRVLFFIGIISFLGGLKHEEFFIGGIIIVVIFGYLGFIHKEKDNREETGNYNKKIKLLQEALDNGLLSQAEFEKKKIELFALNRDQEYERIKERKITDLDELFREGLVNQSEYDQKKKDIENNLIDQGHEDNSPSQKINLEIVIIKWEDFREFVSTYWIRLIIFFVILLGLYLENNYSM